MNCLIIVDAKMLKTDFDITLTLFILNYFSFVVFRDIAHNRLLSTVYRPIVATLIGIFYDPFLNQNNFFLNNAIWIRKEEKG